MNDAPPIPASEFEQRRARAAEGARKRGLDGLLVVARGGGTLDRYGDVMYLADYYTPFPYIPDNPRHWSARAHAFLLLPVDGQPLLVADTPDTDGVALPREHIVLADLVLETLVEQLAARGLDAARLGLVGGDAFTVNHFLALTRALPALRLEPADDLLAALRALKSPAEIERLRVAARIGSRVIEAMLDAARPGATHGEVVAAGMQRLLPAGGILYNSFMASGRGGPEACVQRSRFPTWASRAPLAEGEWLRLGISGVVHGYYFDVSRSAAIGRAGNAQVDAFEAAISVVEAGIERLQPGARASDAALAGRERQRALGYPLRGVFSGLGHGIGLGWDSPWLTPDDHTELRPGMVINVEKTLARDGWLGDFEETVLVTADGFERLTDARLRSW